MRKHILYFVFALFFSPCFSQIMRVDLTLTEASGMMFRDTIIPAGSSVYIFVNPIGGTSTSFINNAGFYYSVDDVLQAHEEDTLAISPSYYYRYLADFPFHVFKKRWQAPNVPGVHILKIWTEHPNGAPDKNPGNDTLTIRLTVKSNAEVVPRTALWEMFTSTSCSPSETYDKFEMRHWWVMNPNQFGSRMAFINYHTNIPGADPSYNADAEAKMNQYSVGGNPLSFVDNGLICTPVAVMAYPDSNTFRKYPDLASYVDMDAEYKIINDSVSVTVRLTPLKAFIDSGYKLNVAIVEDACNYHTWLQEYVFRKMLPNPNGQPISLSQAQVQQTYTFGYKFQTGNVTSGSFNLWGGMNNIKAVAFINKNDGANTPNVQAAIAHPAGWSSVGETTHKSFKIYPNPALEFIAVSVEQEGEYDVEFFNLNGQKVNCSRISAESGFSVFSTEALTPGMYVIKIVFADNTSTYEKFFKAN